GLLAVDWRTDRIVTKVMHEDAIDLATIASLYADLEKDAVDSLIRDGIDLARIRVAREADIRYAGQSMEVRVAAPAGAVDAAFLAALIDAFHAAHLRTFGYNYAGEQKIELVNFCVSGFGLIERPEMPKLAARGASTPARKSVRPVYFDGAFRDTPVYDRAVLPPGFSARRAGGRGGIRLDHRCLSRPAARRRSARHPDRSLRASEIGRRSMNPRPVSATVKLSQPRAARDVDPIVLQIVEGTLNSIEAEIEYAIERTARSPMIREAHDYRVGLFDRHCRKLTGRSYSAMPNAVVRDFPPETMRPGDVFLMNDTYLTEGSIGHLPDLCSTVPVFHDGEVVAFIQAFGHHDDIGGRVPGSMPG